MGNVITCKDVTFYYDVQPAIQNINLDIEERDFMAILGPNGGGKTTLIKLLLGLLTPSSGIIKVLETTPFKARKNIGYVPQYGAFDRNFPIKVKEVVMMSQLKSNSILPWYPKEVEKRANQILEQLQIKHLAEKKLNEISEGQKQRTLIARALMTDPEILILDEPTASIDTNVEKDVYDMLKELNETKTIILISHDIGFVSTYVNKVTCLNICSCTHKLDEIHGSIVDIYNRSLKFLHHKCNL